MKVNRIISSAVDAFYRVYNTLGYGFGRDIYLNAMIEELKQQGLDVRRDCPVRIYYRGTVAGEIRFDLLLEESVVLTVSTVQEIMDHHELKFENMVSSTWCEAGLLLNFGTAPEIIRKANRDVRPVNSTAIAAARCA